MTGRQRLPNRRGHELVDFEHGGIRYTAGIGRFEDGALAEIFLNTAKHGTPVMRRSQLPCCSNTGARLTP
jgi:hypothetical protein